MACYRASGSTWARAPIAWFRLRRYDTTHSPHDEDEEEEEEEDIRLSPYVQDAAGIVDMVACIATWRLKRLARNLGRIRKG